jgi:hypothetical protein
MPEIKVGLSNQMGSFYDAKTNMYITPSNPVQVLAFDNNTDLSGIVHAILGSAPALHLYEGDLPQAAVDAWKAKYDLAGKMAKNRADQIAGATRGPVVEVDTTGHGQVKENPADAITAQSEGAAELVLDLGSDSEPAPAAAVTEGQADDVQEPAASKRSGRNK